MAEWLKSNSECRAADMDAVAQSIAMHEAPFRVRAGNTEAVRESLLDCMWNDVGILRDAQSLKRALGRLSELDEDLDLTGVDGAIREYNMSWHDWLNLKSLIAVSRAAA